LLIKVFFGRFGSGERLREILTVARAQHSGQLAAYRKIQPMVEAYDRFEASTLRFGVAYEEAILDWIDALLAEGIAAVRDAEPESSSGRG